MLDVHLVLQDGDVRRIDFSLLEFLPVDSFEDRVAHQFTNSISSKSLLRVFLQQSCQEVTNDLVVKRVELRFFEQDALLNFFSGFRVVRWHTSQHLVHDTTIRPPITGIVIVLFENNLRCDVLKSSTERVSASILALDSLLTQSKISEFGVPISPDQNVLRFHVSVDDAVFVQFIKSKQDVCCIEDSRVLFETTNVRYVEKEFTSRAVVQNEVEFLCSLVSIVQFDDERTVDFLQNLALIHSVLDLLLFLEITLL